MSTTRGATLALCLGLCGCSAPAGPHAASPRSVKQHRPDGQERATISPVAIEAHLRFLADDLLEGRSIGSRGLALAARYHESRFRALGLEPLFDGSFRQPFALQGSKPDPAAQLEIVGHGGAALRHRQDFVVVSERPDCPQSVEGELVYGGYLIQAPGRRWDDIKGADLKDKILLVEVNEPGNRQGGIFDGKAMTYYGRWTYKFEQAGRLGARGVLIVHNRERATYGWDVVRNSWSGEGFFIGDDRPRPCFQGWVQEQVAQRLLRQAKLDHAELLRRAEQRSFKPVPTGLKVRVRQRPTFRQVTVENVAGLLRARHPQRRDDYVVLVAHFDHLGRGEGGEGADRIYNGAVDNCSASAAMLEVARALASRPERLRDNVIFLGATAEEEGLWGSDYFAHNLPVERDKVLAAITFEMTNVWGATRELYAIGGQQSTLDETCRRAARAIGAGYVPEQGRENGFFFRSDQLSFARVGIPAVWLHEGERPARVKALRTAYRETHYHKVSDDVRVLERQWDLRGTAQIARWAAAIVEQLGQQGHRPRFVETSAFAQAR